MILGTLSLTCLLGITWIFGLLLTTSNARVSVIGAYLFTVFNASQVRGYIKGFKTTGVQMTIPKIVYLIFYYKLSGNLYIYIPLLDEQTSSEDGWPTNIILDVSLGFQFQFEIPTTKLSVVLDC